MTESLKTLTDRANVLKAERRFDEAVALYAKAAQTHPQSIAAEHIWAVALGDAGRASEAEKHIRRALAKYGALEDRRHLVGLAETQRLPPRSRASYGHRP